MSVNTSLTTPSTPFTVDNETKSVKDILTIKKSKKNNKKTNNINEFVNTDKLKEALKNKNNYDQLKIDELLNELKNDYNKINKIKQDDYESNDESNEDSDDDNIILEKENIVDNLNIYKKLTDRSVEGYNSNNNYYEFQNNDYSIFEKHNIGDKINTIRIEKNNNDIMSKYNDLLNSRNKEIEIDCSVKPKLNEQIVDKKTPELLMNFIDQINKRGLNLYENIVNNDETIIYENIYSNKFSFDNNKSKILLKFENLLFDKNIQNFLLAVKINDKNYKYIKQQSKMINYIRLLEENDVNLSIDFGKSFFCLSADINSKLEHGEISSSDVIEIINNIRKKYKTDNSMKFISCDKLQRIQELIFNLDHSYYLDEFQINNLDSIQQIKDTINENLNLLQNSISNMAQLLKGSSKEKLIKGNETIRNIIDELIKGKGINNKRIYNELWMGDDSNDINAFNSNVDTQNIMHIIYSTSLKRILFSKTVDKKTVDSINGYKSHDYESDLYYIKNIPLDFYDVLLNSDNVKSIDWIINMIDNIDKKIEYLNAFFDSKLKEYTDVQINENIKSILELKYEFTKDNENDKVKSSELLNFINSFLKNKLNNIQLSPILSNIGLNKKRFNTGIYWIGLKENQEENNNK